MNRGGFTLLEMLVVLGILGILLAIGTPGYLRWLAGLETQGAAVELAQQIQRVRTEAKRGTEQSVQTVLGSSSVTVGSRSVVLSGATVQTSDTLTFQPPYGTLTGATPRVMTVRSTRYPSLTRTVRVISIMGRVIVQ
ncbi:pilus assembly FimT family protein [Deinococcus petrolearius]|uniref:Tfp pilus assembly protein FimT/FimU n=1 Tax=Deinococcus petrolearius TaxID=1751295 RepID=A0ABW1DNZ6_9DEIO